jgi:hypothetical protein
VNNVRVADPSRRLAVREAIEGKLFLVRKGRKDYYLLRVAS